MDGIWGTSILLIAFSLMPGKGLPFLLNNIKISSLKITGGLILSNTLTVAGDSSNMIKLEVDYIIIKYYIWMLFTF